MATRPDFVQIQTWNDGPEGHNIGNLWPEQNTDYQPSLYMESHDAWRPLITSFITAWKAGGSISSMLPPSGGDGSGAMWYRSMPMDAVCAWDDGIINGSMDALPYEKPFGFDSGTDTISWLLLYHQAMLDRRLQYTVMETSWTL